MAYPTNPFLDLIEVQSENYFPQNGIRGDTLETRYVEAAIILAQIWRLQRRYKIDMAIS